ncbi:Membrane-anchored ubiquitin-fold protein 4 [Tetrabaena socialis]|uniref:Membrane-anchored ubiquitin-fold protein 4 n=1 Tax=Tetrabaena socialis TaxID=47790 RepID=A0A2J8A249_9CHLO|nr:Membrane-anchored ubiquitin-fold protein 4 [Tetrabaena socialis]|eukprot:PNH06568.1 Membrane-anchored ubiquitin-fold protein 4 [Tetrabaena socialis]
MEGDAISIRFRHSAGDLGPFPFSESVSVQTVKDKVFAEWPKDGLWSKETPAQAVDVRLILSGKFLDSAKGLREYKRDMGELKADTVVTMLVHIRPQPAPTKQQGAQAPGKVEKSPCGCVVS